MLVHRHLSVAIDIDADTVGLALLSQRKDSSLEVLYSLRAPHNKKQVRFVLRELFIRLHKEAPTWISRHVDHVLVAVSAPHSHSEAVIKRHDSPQTVLGADTFEEELVGLYVNGYEVSPALSDKKPATWESDSVVSSASGDFLRNIEDEIISALGSKRGVIFRSLVSVCSTLLSRRSRHLGSLVVIHASRSNSEVVLYENGRLSRVVTLNIGTQVFSPTALEQSLVLLALDRALLPDKDAEIKKRLDEYGSKWLEVWKSTCGDKGIESAYIISDKFDGKVLEYVLSSSFPKARVSSARDALSTLALYSNSLL